MGAYQNKLDQNALDVHNHVLRGTAMHYVGSDAQCRLHVSMRHDHDYSV